MKIKINRARDASDSALACIGRTNGSRPPEQAAMVNPGSNTPSPAARMTIFPRRGSSGSCARLRPKTFFVDYGTETRTIVYNGYKCESGVNNETEYLQGKEV